MLFSKKKNFSVVERQTKEILKDDEKAVLILNLRFPELQCPKNDPLAKHAMPFYKKISDGFLEYSKTELFNKAKSKVCDNSPPFSALMRFEKSFESESFLSILIEISVSNGVAPPIIEKKTQTWNRKSGLLCKASDFVDEKAVSELKKEFKSRFDKNLFVLKEGGVEFFIGDEVRFVPHKSL